MKDSIFIVVPDGVGIKNYLYTNVFKDNHRNLILFHNLSNNAVLDIQEKTKIENQILIPEFKESHFEKFLRELICLTRLKNNARITNNKSLLANWNWNQKKNLNKIFYKTIELISIFIKRYKIILSLENQYQKEIRKNEFYEKIKAILIQQKPKKLFCTHQRGLKMATLFAAAQDLGIETTTVIYSWDNLPKARLALKADKYLVWSDYMKSEMQMYYPEINQKNVIVTGTPQFEFYNNPENILNKKAFYESYNLDFNKKIICFSGDDDLTSPDDPKYLDDIANAIKINNLDNKFQILLRRCPVDISGRYDEILKKYPDLIKVADPLWNFDCKNSWQTIYPTFDDVKLLVSTVYYSDLVINLGSTMAFDFAMFNKPCIYINYDQQIKTNPKWFIETLYKFQHFKSMPSAEAVIWINNKQEIILKIHEALLFKNKQKMKLWKEKILYNTDNSSTNISTNIFK